MRSHRILFSLAGIFLVGSLTPWGWAKEPVRSTTQRTAQASPEERVGIDPQRRRPMSLHDVILMALRNNRDIEIERISGEQAAYQLDAARGRYDPEITTNFSFQSATVPVGSVLAGGASGSVSTDTYVYGASIRQLLPGGSNYELTFDNNRLTSSNVFITLNPQFSSNLRFTWRQPLLRNRGWDASRRAIRIAKKRLNLSDTEFRQRVIEIINRVQKAYWDLVFARRNVQVQREAVNLAREQLEINRRMVAAGTLAPVEIIAAEAEVKRREENLLTAIEGVTVAENILKGLILAERTDPLWREAIIPTESAEIKTVPFDLAEAVRTALQSRPEMEQIKLQREINDLDIRYFRNQTRPQLDLVGIYEINGLAGRLRRDENPFSAGNRVLLNRVNALSELAGLPPLELPPPARLPRFLLGGQARAWANLFGNDFRTVQLGISLSLPLRNRTAEGNLGEALAAHRLLEAQRQKLELAIEIDVRNALQAVETARKRVEATRAAREAAEANLASEQRRYRAGETTNFMVLTRQNELSAARAQELRALMDYNKAIADLQRATATTLSAYHVQIDRPPRDR